MAAFREYVCYDTHETYLFTVRMSIYVFESPPLLTLEKILLPLYSEFKTITFALKFCKIFIQKFTFQYTILAFPFL